MRLNATFDLYLPGEAVLRSPTLWERARRAFGAKLDLATDRLKTAFEATALVDQVRAALRRLGIDNAVALVVDDQVVFSDTDGKPGDMPDLMLALSEHASLFGNGFRTLRFAVEHEDQGLHYVLETQAMAEHHKDEPAARLRIGARVQDLEPRRGENAQEYRARVVPVANDSALLEGYRRQFEASVARMSDALRAALPEGRVEEQKPEARVVKPSNQPAPAPPPPNHPAYDPYAAYYPSPFEGLLSGLLISSFLTSALHTPHVLVVHPSGEPIADAGDLGSHMDQLSPDAADPGAGFAEAASLEGGDYEGEGEDGDGPGGDGDGDGDWGGGDWGGDGGDFGGDF